MNRNTKQFFKNVRFGFALGAGILLAAAGCTPFADKPVAKEAALRAAEPIAMVNLKHNSYTYFPAYDVYSNDALEIYLWPENGTWVQRRVNPRGVPVAELLASPSVKLDFHDFPDRHREEVLEKYPTNWKPAAAK